jgi:Fe2+ transport system protein FeoA
MQACSAGCPCWVYNENHSHLDDVTTLTLNDLQPQIWRRIFSLKTEGEGASEVARRLADLGFVPQERVCVLRRSWWKKGALVVQVGNATFALRHSEAACIELVP